MNTEKIKLKKKNYYMKSNRKKLNNVDINFKGFLCTCNNREKECVRESYNILNKVAHTLYGETIETTDVNKETDITDEIAKEIQDLKSDIVPKKKKFSLCDSGAKNIVFIRTSLENPVEIAEHLVKEIHETKKQQTRFLIRLVPIEITCKAYIENIEKSFESIAGKYFSGEGKSYSIVYNHRNNSSLSKDEVIKRIADKISSFRQDHKVNLKEAEISVVIEVIRGFAFIGIVPNFLKYKKYNLLALCENVIQDEVSKPASNISE
ncbi:hypothetical protein WA026_012886 [Henosepilachna vigintioctopunctata]|uniref:THUMP domain-containing protein n=1 Tax=Henosepilachna vigintioctopunctata TaxID=420089 RepID=A0AAW1TS78_9CUCU